MGTLLSDVAGTSRKVSLRLFALFSCPFMLLDLFALSFRFVGFRVKTDAKLPQVQNYN